MSIFFYIAIGLVVITVGILFYKGWREENTPNRAGSVGSNLVKYVFKSGIPFSFKYGWLPVMPCFAKGLISQQWIIRFDDLWVLPHPKNHSWQKGGGRSYDVLTNHTDSIMWAFRRVNVSIDEIEISSYAHVNGVVVKEDNNVLKIKKGEVAFIDITDDRPNGRYVVVLSKAAYPDDKIVHIIPYTHTKTGGKTITPWFEYPNSTVRLFMDK